MQNLFGFISHPMALALSWLANAVGSAGIAIILFTILVRLLLSPLQITQLRNAKAMQALQPKMAALKEKHGKDREAMSRATMEMYREHGANPAMGCVPSLLQFPILIGLFYGLLHLGQTPTVVHGVVNWTKSSGCAAGVHSWSQFFKNCYSVSGSSVSTSHIYDLFHAHFLWLSNGLGQSDPLYILPVLAGVTQWIQMRMMATRSTDPQQQMMNNMMNFMPLVIVFFALRYASGLSLYWVTSTIIGILIQYRITGLGMLPRRLNFAGGVRMAGFTAKTPPRTTGAKPAKALADGNGQTEAPRAANSNGALNGKNGKAVDAQRKKANRARGGRQSGRRG